MRSWIAAVTCLLVVPGLLSAQALRGRVMDARSGLPVPLAEVSLVTESGSVIHSSLADPSGRFFMAVPFPGSHYLYAEGLGFYSGVEGPLHFESGDTVIVEFRLQPSPVQLDSLAVSAERRTQSLERVGFYRRAASGQGHFVDRAKIEEQVAAQTISDLLVGIPGIRIGKTGEVSLTGMGSLHGGCEKKIYIDGIQTEDPFWTKAVHPMNIEALEVYRRPSEVPAQYGGSQSGCGVILIWTRKGG